MRHFRAINRSIVGLKKQLRSAVKELNQEAAKLVTRGRYEASSALVETARRTADFVTEVETLRERWRTLRSGGVKTEHGEKTPLWEYYELVARALAGLGGQGKRAEVIEWIGKSALDKLKPGDLARTPRGKLVWQRNVERAKRAMLKEGFLEPSSGSNWKLSQLGHDIAKSQDTKPAKS